MVRLETMQKFQDELKFEEQNSKDSIVKAKEFQFENHKYTKWSKSQISNKLGIPMKYFERMENEAPELLVQNVDTWLKRDNRNFLVRELTKRDGNTVVRAFLSDRYLPLSNRTVCNTVAVTLYEMKVPFEVLRQWLTENAMYVTITSPTKYDLGGGDTVQLGITVKNSELGFASFSAQTFMFRHACKNGMIFGRDDVHSLTKRHIGSRIKSTIDLSDTTKRLDIATTLSSIRDIVKGSFDPNSFLPYIERVKQGKNVVVNDKVEAIGILKEQQKLSDELEKTILSEFKENTQYGMANAITAAARQQDNEENQISLEELGGEVMLLNAESFKKAYTVKEK